MSSTPSYTSPTYSGTRRHEAPETTEAVDPNAPQYVDVKKATKAGAGSGALQGAAVAAPVGGALISTAALAAAAGSSTAGPVGWIGAGIILAGAAIGAAVKGRKAKKDARDLNKEIKAADKAQEAAATAEKQTTARLQKEASGQAQLASNAAYATPASDPIYQAAGSAGGVSTYDAYRSP